MRNEFFGLLAGLLAMGGAVVTLSALAVAVAVVRALVAERRARPYLAASDGARREQHTNIAALRDSGALTDKEYEAEKLRIDRS